MIQLVKIGNINLTEHKPALKMGGFLSINVSVDMNPFCQSMRNSSTICSKCYARYMEQQYPRLKNTLEENYITLSSRVLDESEISEIAEYILKHAKGLRFDSIGELINETHCDNLNLIAMKVKSISANFPITIWTKKAALSNAIDRTYIKKIFSNALIDEPLNEVPRDFDGVFNVCSYEWFLKNKMEPNCTGHCAYCMACYDPQFTGFIIYEMLKQDQNRLKRSGIWL